MDSIDKKILELLQQDCMDSYKEIANKVGLSYNPTYERIRRMEEEGVIRSRVAILDPKKIGIHLFVYCNIILKEQSKQSLIDFEQHIATIPEVIEAVSLTGTYDYMLKIAISDIDSYNSFIMNKIANIPNIGQYHSNIVMSTIKNETALPILIQE